MKKTIGAIEYSVVWSQRKTIGLYVNRNGSVEVRAPKQVPLKLIEDFVQEKQAWIAKQQAAWQALPAPHVVEFSEGSIHYFLGEPHTLNLGTAYQKDLLSIDINPRKKDQQSVSNALERWYRHNAQAVFSERHEYWRSQLADWALPNSKLALRKMKRRWGSCSRQGLITLNTQLVRYPLTCIDAVIVHELCHLLEFNHSQRFYRLMDQAYPQWKQADKLLKKLAYQY